MHNAVVIRLKITREEFLKLYAGKAKDVVATAVDGRRVQFPARILQPFVTHAGINGMFRISYDREARFDQIQRLH